MASDGPVADDIKQSTLVIELANKDEVRDYLQRVQEAAKAFEALLYEAPPLRFAPKSGVKGN